MARFIINWIVNIAALFIVINIVPGVSAANAQAIIVAALVLGFLNAFLRPLLLLLTIPLNVLTLGIFTLVINGLLFYIAAHVVKGFIVKDFWSAFWAAIVFSVISFIINMLVRPAAPAGFRTSGHVRQDDENVKRYPDAIDVEGKVEE